MCKITLYNTQRDLPLSLAQYRKTIVQLLRYLNISTDELIVHFVTSKKICTIHQAHFNDPSVTDCISFPIDGMSRKGPDYHLLGEIFVCPKVASEYALAHQLSPQEELLRYVIHGILHLIGYDDIEPADYKKMKRRERTCLNMIKTL